MQKKIQHATQVTNADGRIQLPRTALADDLVFVADIIDAEGNRVGLHSKDA
jgi:predicted enzyme related to lactoylglutathione lyase